jgi:hypothetical protein
MESNTASLAIPILLQAFGVLEELLYQDLLLDAASEARTP